jgi:hypothetical protein
MNKKILHLLQPDTKFSDYIIDCFEKIHPKQNKYIMIVSQSKLLEFTTTKYFKQIEFISENKFLFFDRIGQWDNYEAVIVYAMCPFRAELAKDIPENIKVAWVIFGYEFYTTFPEIKNKIYLKETRMLFSKSLRSKIVNTVAYRKICRLIGKPHVANQLEVGFERANVFGGLIREEGELIKERLNLNYEIKDFCIASIENLIGDTDQSVTCEGSNILLGNSSSSTNNHLEILQFLSKQPIGARKIITPLSYGNEDYCEKIIEYGKELLPNNFKPLTTFLSKYEYNTILLSCNIAIMNHMRQQALGNIISLLWFGTKVFLNEENPVYQYLKRINIIVFSIKKDLYIDFNKSLNPLTKEEVEYNRSIIIVNFSKKAVLERNKGFLTDLIK